MAAIPVVLIACGWDLGYRRAMIRGVRAAAERHGWALDLRAPEAPLRHRHGAIGCIAEVPGAAARALRGRLPLVGLLGRHGTPQRPVVRVDDQAIGRAAARHLLERGFRTCACIVGPDGAWLALRNRGFRAEVLAAGGRVLELDLQGRDLARQLADVVGPLGVFAGNDGFAGRVCEACFRARIAVPGQVAVVGADDDDLFCALSRPALSSVRIPFDRVGEAAGDLLAGLLAGRAGPAQREIPPLGVVERASTATSAIDDDALARAQAAMRARACHGLGPQGAARAAGVSRRTLERRWKTRFGGTLAAHLAATRVVEAERLITTTRLPLGEIARRCGYPGPSQLSRAVRGRYGKTPTALRACK